MIEPQKNKKVWVVSGRNEEIRKNFFAFLRSIGLDPIEWSRAVKSPSPYVGQILKDAFAEAQAFVVLLTPEDVVYLHKDFWNQEDENPLEMSPALQARANVLFEAGMAMGMDEDRTLLIQFGHIKPFSDIGGRHVLRWKDSTEIRQQIAQRLRTAGCDVNLDGTDWYTEGKFELRIPQIEEKPEKPDSKQMLDEESLQLLRLISDEGGKTSDITIHGKSKHDRLKTDFLIDKLVEAKAIKKHATLFSVNSGSITNFSLTPDGRKYLLER